MVFIQVRDGDAIEEFSLDAAVFDETFPFLSQRRVGRGDSIVKINCEIRVFKWLLLFSESTYLKMDPPYLDRNMIVSILLSSSFLGMRCVQDVARKSFFSELSHILMSDVQLSCISEEIMSELSNRMELRSIVRAVSQTFNKAISKENAVFLRSLMRNTCTLLIRFICCENEQQKPILLCETCGAMFTNDVVAPCEGREPLMGARGELKSKHSSKGQMCLCNSLISLTKGVAWEKMRRGILLAPQSPLEHIDHVMLFIFYHCLRTRVETIERSFQADIELLLGASLELSLSTLPKVCEFNCAHPPCFSHPLCDTVRFLESDTL